MDILVYLQIFALITHAIIMFFFPRFFPYKTYVIFIVALTALFIVLFILNRKGNVPVVFGRIFIVYAIIAFCYAFVTPAFYSTDPGSNHSGSLLCIVGQILPNGLYACFVAEDEKLQDKIKKLAPFVGAIFAIIALICTLRPTSVTSAGFMDNENGLGYQRVSYMAAYSAALMEYYLLTRDQMEQFKILNDKIGSIVSAIVIFLDLIVVLLSGGRGGFVAYLLFLAISIFLAIRFGKYKSSKIFRLFLIILLVAVAGYFGIRYVSNSTISTSGYSRILRLVSGGVDNNRFYKYQEAFDLFAQKPIIGHGFGSVYWELGLYSHNFFTDILIEGGAILLIVILALLIFGFVASIKLIRIDKSDLLWIYFFLCGFILAMFSGYYLTQIPLYWGLIFIFSKYKVIRIKQLNDLDINCNFEEKQFADQEEKNIIDEK